MLGEIIVRGDQKEIILDYGFSKTQSKKLSSVQKRKIPHAFKGTLFNNFKYHYKAFTLSADKSNVYFLLPAALDRSEEKIYFNSVKLSPIDVEEDSFISDSKIIFDPSKLDINNPQEKMFSEAIIQKMKLVAEISNSNIVRNAQCFLLTKKIRGQYLL